MTDLQDLRSEHAQGQIGQLIQAEVWTLVSQIAGAYPPGVYAGTSAWTREAFDDLAQDVFAYWLLEQGQLTYILGVARTMSEFRALVANTIKRALVHRRQRSVVDNLLDRCRTLLAKEPFQVIRVAGRDVYRTQGADPYIGDPPEEQLRAAELLAMTIPRLPPERGERASPVYSTPNLRAVLLAVASIIPRGFALRDLDRILGRILTPWLVRSLETEGVLSTTAAPQLSPEEVVIVRDVTASLLEELSDDQKALLGLYLANANDADIALALGLKARQTIIRRRAEVATILASHLEGLPRSLADMVVGGLAVALVTSRSGADA